MGCFLDGYGDDNGDCNGFDGVENKDCVKQIFGPFRFSHFLSFAAGAKKVYVVVGLKFAPSEGLS